MTRPQPLRWTAPDAAAASMAVADLWAAIQDDDDAAALAATSASIHDQHGTSPGFCERLRESFQVSQEVAGRMGTSSMVRVVDGHMIFMCVDTGPGHQRVSLGAWGPELVNGWALWTALERGRWVVAGTYVPEAERWPEGTEYLDLPHAPNAGPVQ